LEKKQIGSISEFNGRYLFPISKEHIYMLKDWRNSQMDVLRQWRPLTENNQDEWFQQISRDNNQVIFSLMAKDDQKNCMFLIGYCGITNIDFRNRRGEISFLVNPVRVKDEKLYRQDLLSALYMLCEYGFGRLNLNKLFTETFESRNQHISILEGFGFCLEGRLREHVFVNGQYQVSLIHSVLSSEWTLSIKDRIGKYVER